MKIIKISALALSIGLMSFSTINSRIDNLQQTISVGSTISWTSEEIDLGEIKRNVPANIIFEFKNTGNTAVVISNVQGSCGCTTTNYTKTPVQPGETATIEATFNAANLGAFTKTVTVTTTADKTPKVLTFKGTVI